MSRKNFVIFTIVQGLFSPQNFVIFTIVQGLFSPQNFVAYDDSSGYSLRIPNVVERT
jgi:hypothetical protein